nr:skin secretory protein xP2-like [Dasypus novemcinctus]
MGTGTRCWKALPLADRVVLPNPGPPQWVALEPTPTFLPLVYSALAVTPGPGALALGSPPPAATAGWIGCTSEGRTRWPLMRHPQRSDREQALPPRGRGRQGSNPKHTRACCLPARQPSPSSLPCSGPQGEAGQGAGHAAPARGPSWCVGARSPPVQPAPATTAVGDRAGTWPCSAPAAPAGRNPGPAVAPGGCQRAHDPTPLPGKRLGPSTPGAGQSRGRRPRAAPRPAQVTSQAVPASGRPARVTAPTASPTVAVREGAVLTEGCSLGPPGGGVAVPTLPALASTAPKAPSPATGRAPYPRPTRPADQLKGPESGRGAGPEEGGAAAGLQGAPLQPRGVAPTAGSLPIPGPCRGPRETPRRELYFLSLVGVPAPLCEVLGESNPPVP